MFFSSQEKYRAFGTAQLLLYCVLRVGGIMKVFLFSIFTVVVSTASANDLLQALGSALQEAESNHQAKQVALEVNADQIETAKFHKNQMPKVIQMTTPGMEADISEFATKDMADEIEVEDVTDIAKELSDN